MRPPLRLEFKAILEGVRAGSSAAPGPGALNLVPGV
jgi:hypothetical protein